MRPADRGAVVSGALARLGLASLLAFVVLAACVRADEPAAMGAGPRFALEVAGDSLTPDDEGSWRIGLRVSNPLGYGLYLDSLTLELRDAGPGVTRANAVTTTNLRSFGAQFASIGAGDSVQFSYSMPASCEHGVLVLHWNGHDGQKGVQHASASVPIAPGEFERAHPSRFLTVGKRKVEFVEVAPPDTAKKAPGVLLVHGQGAHARSLLRTAARLSGLGYGVVLVSQPGYGLSDGPADLAGPATVDALAAALAELRRMPRVDPTRLAAWGIGRGATAAMLLSQRKPEGLRAVISQAGVYDAAAWAASAPASEAAVLTEAGTAPDRWASRSPLARAPFTKADVLLVHGRDDAASPIGQARAMAAALRAGGTAVDTLFAGGGQQSQRVLLGKGTIEFLARLSSR